MPIDCMLTHLRIREPDTEVFRPGEVAIGDHDLVPDLVAPRRLDGDAPHASASPQGQQLHPPASSLPVTKPGRTAYRRAEGGAGAVWVSHLRAPRCLGLSLVLGTPSDSGLAPQTARGERNASRYHRGRLEVVCAQ